MTALPPGNVLDRIAAGRAWTDEERMVLDQLRRVADETIAPNAARYDEAGAFPRDSVAALDALGLNAVFVPEAYGGAPTRYRHYLECVSVVSEACASTGIVFATNYHATGPVIDHGTEAQKSRLLPRVAAGAVASLAITEPSAGSDALGMKTRFAPDGDEIVIDGGKIFITSGDVADLVLLFGMWDGVDDPRKAISAVVVEKGAPGFEVLGTEKKMGHRASTTAALSFSGCRVPRGNLLGAPGGGLPLLFSSLNKSRPSIAAHARGVARAAFKDMISWTNEREQSGRRIIEFQGNQFLVADLAAELALIETWIDHVAGLVEAGADDIAVEASIAKLRATDLAMRMTTECVQMHGGYGYCAGHRAERLMRDAKITQIWEGANQIHRQLVGRSFRRK